MTKLKRITVTVYCHADEAVAVVRSYGDFFANHECQLWQPYGPQIDTGDPYEIRKASKSQVFSEDI